MFHFFPQLLVNLALTWGGVAKAHTNKNDRSLQKLFKLLHSKVQGITGFPLGQENQGSQGKPGNLLEGQGKPGKLEIFWKKSGKSQQIKFLSMQYFKFNKKTICM